MRVPLGPVRLAEGHGTLEGITANAVGKDAVTEKKLART